MYIDSSNPTDDEIVLQIINGNVNAFEFLVKRYEFFVLNMVKRHIPYNEVEEVVQDAFIRIYQALPSFKGKGEFKGWISTITIRACYDFWRKAYRLNEIPMSALNDTHRKWLEDVISNQSAQSLHEKISRNEAHELLEWALGKLGPKDRMVLELVYLEDLTGKEAADLLGWSVANVKIRAFRSRKKLYKLLMEIME